MSFNSLQYFVFLPVVYLLYYLCGERGRWLVLLGASLLFYGALKAPYLPAVLALVTLMTYGFGIWLDGTESPGRRRLILWSGVALDVAVLVALKYLPALLATLPFAAQLPVPQLQGMVTIGISYFVFQAISYLFDIYLEVEKAERHLGYFALYLAFFPKLLQGPIERAGALLPQLKAKYHFNYDNMRAGALLFTWGLFKKVVVADSIARCVNDVYGGVHGYGSRALLFATYAYAVQILMDFSGYTDMALGSARLFNITLTQNFNAPYLATSVADFWRRWHISFSRWILDYIFKPLQMQWRSWRNWGSAAALVVAFLISGIWHGAKWGFVIWGGLHGVYMACSIFYKPYQKRLHKALKVEKTQLLKLWQMYVTFNLVTFAWIFFRAESLQDALYVVRTLCTGAQGSVLRFVAVHAAVQLLVLSGLWGYLWIESSKVRERALPRIAASPTLRWASYYALVLAVLFFYQQSTGQFIYFKF